jgi:hypothetical protein
MSTTRLVTAWATSACVKMPLDAEWRQHTAQAAQASSGWVGSSADAGSRFPIGNTVAVQIEILHLADVNRSASDGVPG